jgi:hypothetical protein
MLVTALFSQLRPPEAFCVSQVTIQRYNDDSTQPACAVPDHSIHLEDNRNYLIETYLILQFGSHCQWFCETPAILTEQGSINLAAQGLVVAAIRENFFPADAARLMRRGESDSVRIAAIFPAILGEAAGQ